MRVGRDDTELNAAELAAGGGGVEHARSGSGKAASTQTKNDSAMLFQNGKWFAINTPLLVVEIST